MSAGSMQVPVGRAVTVRVPATSANLGPGFDTLGLALGYYDQLDVTVRLEAGATVEVIGEGSADSAAPVATDASNLVVQSIAHAFAHAGVAMPGLNLVAHNKIAHSRGMGSSSAAIVSGLLAAKGLLDGIAEFDEETLLRLATELEGHPDNVAPALFGGLTISWFTEKGPRYVSMETHPDLEIVMIIPDIAVSTKLARDVLPSTVGLEDAIFNISRSSLLIHTLTQRPDLLMSATEDRLHQKYRAGLMQEPYNLMQHMRKSGLAATISGAGPSVMILCNGTIELEKAESYLSSKLPIGWKKLKLGVDTFGGTVSAQVLNSMDR